MSRWTVVLLLIGCRVDTEVTPIDPERAPAWPVLDVQSPARGAFVESPVEVAGLVTEGTGALSSLTIAGEDVSWSEDGRFSHVLELAPGLAILDARAVDDLGERAVDGRAVIVGPLHEPGAVIPGAVRIQLGADLLDDDDADPDDLASIAEAMVTDPAFAEGFAGQSFEGALPATLTGVALTGAAVDITPWHGVVFFDLEMTGFATRFTSEVGSLALSGSTWSDRALIQLDIDARPTPAGDGIEIMVDHAVAYLDGFGWTAEGVPDVAVDTLEATVRALVEDNLATQAATMAEGLLATALGGLILDLDLGLGGGFSSTLALDHTFATPGGLVVVLDAGLSAVGAEVPPAAGSVQTNGPPPPMPVASPHPFVMIIDDDFVNQLLFAAWASGTGRRLHVDGEQLLGLTGEDLPPPLGPVQAVDIDLGLPPVVSVGAGDLPADLGVGELVVDITRADGEHVAASLSTRAGIDLGVGDAGLLVAMDSRPAAVEVQAGMLQWPGSLDPGDLSSLFRLSAPGLVATAAGAFPSVPLPTVDIGALTGVDGLSGVAWRITGGDIAMDDNGWVRIEGSMEVAR